MKTFNVIQKSNHLYVSGRELHKALNAPFSYEDWISCILSMRFINGRDFQSVDNDHILTIGMAKEVCMIHDTPSSWRCRKQLLDIEDQLFEKAFSHKKKSDGLMNRLNFLTSTNLRFGIEEVGAPYLSFLGFSVVYQRKGKARRDIQICLLKKQEYKLKGMVWCESFSLGTGASISHILKRKLTVDNPENFYTIAGFAACHGKKLNRSISQFLGLQASEYSHQNGYKIVRIPFAHYGNLNAYDLEVLTEVFSQCKYI